MTRFACAAAMMYEIVRHVLLSGQLIVLLIVLISSMCSLCLCLDRSDYIQLAYWLRQLSEDHLDRIVRLLMFGGSTPYYWYSVVLLPEKELCSKDYLTIPSTVACALFINFFFKCGYLKKTSVIVGGGSGSRKREWEQEKWLFHA